MAITVQDVQDLIRLLREHPDWRAEMERALLGEEFLSLPQIVRELAESQKRTEARVQELAESQKRTEARVQELAEAQKRTEARVQELAEAQKRTEARVQELVEAQKRTEARMDQLTARMDQLTARMDQLAARMEELARRLEALTGVVERMRGDIGDIRGELLEIKYAERAPVYVSDLMRRARVIPRHDYLAQLEEAEEQGKLTAAERKDAALIDLLLRGQFLPERAQGFIALEISATLYPDDIERAARRAEIFRRVFPVVAPAVGGHGITAEARTLAQEKGVRVTLDGVTL